MKVSKKSDFLVEVTWRGKKGKKGQEGKKRERGGKRINVAVGFLYG